MALAGSNPKKGTYKCIICDHLINLDESHRVLPFCPVCDGISFIHKQLPSDH